MAIRLRLEDLAAQREAVRRALGLLALPHNAPIAAASLWRTVDAIWYAPETAARIRDYVTRTFKKM